MNLYILFLFFFICDPMHKADSDDKEYFPISRLHRDDIKHLYEDNSNYEKICDSVDNLSDQEMEYIARKLGDDYCEQLFWTSLQLIYEEHFQEKE